MQRHCNNDVTHLVTLLDLHARFPLVIGSNKSRSVVIDHCLDRGAADRQVAKLRYTRQH